MKVRVHVRERDQTDIDEDNDVEELQKRISELQRELLKVSADLSIREIVLRKMQFSQALSDKLFDEPLPLSDITVKNGSSSVPGEERRKFEALVQEQSSLSNTILRKHERVEELQKELDNVRKQNFELKKKNRGLMEIITQHRKRLETAMDDVKSSPACLGLKEELENTVARMNIAKCTLQALIVGSGVNWAQDSELAETVFLCGESLNL
ncbi:hypothetical protein C0Q70_19865 [Pomacea canaliculata]|uniref:Centromere protein H C-terminal domain-containing protein n=1 Tax=Pomacea canaliculata TaxID=400727 RepID=A0A2T7NDY2_POMCA|nr:hypothetical protein C0Q70_19865 [Pomacea canaliculata]